MHASPGPEEDSTLVLPWPPGVRIACLCLFHGLFRTIRNGVCQSLTSSTGSTIALYYRESWCIRMEAPVWPRRHVSPCGRLPSVCEVCNSAKPG